MADTLAHAPLLLAADTQALSGLSSSAFTEMAQWPGAAAPSGQAGQAQQLLAHAQLGSGPASPLRVGISPVLQWDIPLIDVDHADEASLSTTAASATPTPRTCKGSVGRKKRPHDAAPSDNTEPMKLAPKRQQQQQAQQQPPAGSFVVPKPIKGSPDKPAPDLGGGMNPPPSRPVVLSGLASRRISFNHVSSGRLSLSPVADAPLSTSPLAARVDTPFGGANGKTKRSASPFNPIKPAQHSLDTLRNINLMVNRSQGSSRGRPRSNSAAGRASAALSTGRSTPANAPANATPANDRSTTPAPALPMPEPAVRSASPAPPARSQTPRPPSTTPRPSSATPTPRAASPAAAPMPPPASVLQRPPSVPPPPAQTALQVHFAPRGSSPGAGGGGSGRNSSAGGTLVKCFGGLGGALTTAPSPIPAAGRSGAPSPAPSLSASDRAKSPAPESAIHFKVRAKSPAPESAAAMALNEPSLRSSGRAGGRRATINFKVRAATPT